LDPDSVVQNIYKKWLIKISFHSELLAVESLWPVQAFTYDLNPLINTASPLSDLFNNSTERCGEIEPWFWMLITRATPHWTLGSA
jgi:hypothetical protein